ncbi:hypothetical protein CHISP_1895 [Chitinispirillum alkaliphilum]|nr:hypothetical protein CHISP_1895 [Chitinispirillum alkaliphilum]
MVKAKKLAITAVPVILVGTGIAAKKLISHKDGKALSEQLREAAKDTSYELDHLISDFKKNIEGKSSSQLEKNIDSLAESTKHRIDRISSQLKDKLHQQKNGKSKH